MFVGFRCLYSAYFGHVVLVAFGSLGGLDQ